MIQLGDYVIETDGQAIPTYCVRMAGAEEYLSNHETRSAALRAVERYQAADRRRSLSRRKSAALAALNEFVRDET